MGEGAGKRGVGRSDTRTELLYESLGKLDEKHTHAVFFSKGNQVSSNMSFCLERT